MALKKKINFLKVKNQVIQGCVDKLYKEGFNIKDGIQQRTLSGKDVNLKSFRPYKPEYAKRKGSNKVDLHVKGHMLSAITFDKKRYGVRFRFNSNAETDKAIGNQRLRYFFGIDKRQIAYLKKKLGKL